jgi:hypothetical protein
MKNVTGTDSLGQRWGNFLKSFVEPYPAVLLATGAILSLSTIFICSDGIKMTLTMLSAIFIGLGVNELTTSFKNTTETSLLRSKAEYTVRSLIGTLENIYYNTNSTSQVDKLSEVLKMVDLIDYWKDYHPELSKATLFDYKLLVDKLKEEADPIKRKELEDKKQKIESGWDKLGSRVLMPISGSL